MPEFNVVSRLQYSPTRCILCGEFEGPFINTFTEVPGYGFVYLCGPNDKRPGCVGQMARQFGFIEPDDRSKIEADLDVAEQKITELEHDLTMYKQMKDAQAFLRKRQTRSLSPETQEEVSSGTV